jgi:hypothetical protein
MPLEIYSWHRDFFHFAIGSVSSNQEKPEGSGFDFSDDSFWTISLHGCTGHVRRNAGLVVPDPRNFVLWFCDSRGICWTPKLAAAKEGRKIEHVEDTDTRGKFGGRNSTESSLGGRSFSSDITRDSEKGL